MGQKRTGQRPGLDHGERSRFLASHPAGLRRVGSGALVVDTASQPVEGGGHPFGYFPQDIIEEQGDEDTQRLVREYDPPTEFVSVLLKSEDRVSSYRL
jgi:hypothetical protein